MHDIVIRGGTIIDGTGRAAFTGDVAIAGGRIAAVGGKAGPARREIDAAGLLVTPGWVDVHTHYDGQAMWDPLLAPSCWHGVTTVMFGNCGVGFAPGMLPSPAPAHLVGSPPVRSSTRRRPPSLDRSPTASTSTACLSAHDEVAGIFVEHHFIKFVFVWIRDSVPREVRQKRQRDRLLRIIVECSGPVTATQP